MYKIYFFKTKASLGICSLAVGIFLIAHVYASRLHDKVNLLQEQLLHMNQQYAHSVEVKSFIQEHEKDFEDFTKCQFDRCITDETLKKQQLYRIEFEPYVVLGERFVNSGIVSQNILIHIPCLMDKDVFKVINQLFEQGPGIFHIKEVEIKRLSALNEDILEKVATGKPQILFDGRIKATWVHRS